MPSPGARPLALVTAACLLAILALGVGLRAQQIGETRAIGAEDPYTHVVFTRESLASGAFGDSRMLATSMYPPGMHAMLGVLASLSGIPVVALAKWLPLAFAALAIVGTFALAGRLGGPAAGLGAALLMAIVPEAVFRTQLLFPTALDLALLPAWLLAFHEACRPGDGRLRIAASAFFLALSVPLAWMHPWVVPLFAGPALVYVGLRVARSGGSARLAAKRMAPAVGLAAVATAFAMASRWDVSDTGFSAFLADIGPLSTLAAVDLPAALLFGLLASLLVLVFAPGVAMVAVLARLRLPGRVARDVSLALALVIVVVAWSWPQVRGPPHEVSYEDNLGPLAIALGLTGVLVALLRPSPLGDLGLSIALLLGPLTAVDVFGSPFWPARTVVYFALGVALLGGAVVGAAGTVALAWLRTPRARRMALPFAPVVALLLVAAPALAMPAPMYDWYRLYDDDDHAALERTAAMMEPGSRVFVHSWQPALLLKALGDPERVWYSPNFYVDGGKRDEQLGQVHGSAYVVVDRFLQREVDRGRADVSFLDDHRVVVHSADAELRVYQVK